MKEILADIVDMGVRAITFSGGGEPLTYAKITDSVRILKDGKVELSLITNGELLDEERAEAFYGAKWVRISFDSPIEEEYCKLRGLMPDDFQRVIRNIESFALNKDKDCVLGVNYVVSKENYHHVYEAAKLLKQLGADNVKFAAVVDNKQSYHINIKEDVITQIHNAIDDFQDDDFRIINDYENDWMDKNFTGVKTEKCYTCRLVTVIAADQRVYLCHTQAYDSRAIVGDLRETCFKDLWFSETTKERLTKFHPPLDCHSNCVYESRNEAIQGYFEATEHVNFI